MKNYIEYDGQVFPIRHNLGDIVYLKTDPNQLKGIVTGYQHRGNKIIYLVSQCASENAFSDYELSTEPDTLMLSLSGGGDD
jgi:hypothetical protein